MFVCQLQILAIGHLHFFGSIVFHKDIWGVYCFGRHSINAERKFFKNLMFFFQMSTKIFN